MVYYLIQVSTFRVSIIWIKLVWPEACSISKYVVIRKNIKYPNENKKHNLWHRLKYEKNRINNII